MDDGQEKYTRQVLDAYRKTPGTSGTVRRLDRMLAGQLYQRGISASVIENAFVLAATRRAKLGIDLSTWMAIVFVCVTVFLVGFRMLAILAFATLAVGAWLIVRYHPKMFTLWGLSLSQKSYYDPRKY